ncbi:MAG TPA: TrkH family potassium uptake protein, partial [Coriobacteriia bacterium]|nr:TrkH family potassium uptake protein [Coriobacteriia bacterium]
FNWNEMRSIAHFLGRLLYGIALVMLLPLATALVFREWDPALDYVVGISATAFVATLLVNLGGDARNLSRREALIISGLAWLTATALGALPLVLSGHYGSYLDAAFEAASGFTTSGLTLTQNADHLANAHNMWRHLTHLLGGQGIIVAAVSLAIGIKGGAFSLYLAEARDEQILPNVVHTARFIWFVTGTYVVLGTLALTVVGLWHGMSLDRGFLHAFWLTIAAYDTGGFAPQSQNMLYYHSALFEVVTVVAMLAGTLNFNLHADMWRGDKGEIFHNLEARTLAANVLILTAFTGAAMGASRWFSGPAEIVRKGAYHIISANSGTGHQTLYTAQWADVGPGAFYAVILAMAFGGMMSSTAGGIKAMRIGLMIKAVVLEIRRVLSPHTAVVRIKFHHLTDRQLTPELVAGALMMFALYIVTYITGGLIGAAYGYPLDQALFESVSAAANVGLSTGITSPTMPTGLKILYTAQMWFGRLEFFTLLALVVAIFTTGVPRRTRA